MDNKKESPKPDKNTRKLKTAKQFNNKLDELVASKIKAINKYTQSRTNNANNENRKLDIKEEIESEIDEYCNPWDM